MLGWSSEATIWRSRVGEHLGDGRDGRFFQEALGGGIGFQERADLAVEVTVGAAGAFEELCTLRRGLVEN